MDWRIVSLFCVVCFNLSGATICVPNSRFKMDCNVCECSSNGKEYSCTNKQCPQRNYDGFYSTQTKSGHTVLVPKYEDQVQVDDNSIKGKSRKTRVPSGYPYINDEMTSMNAIENSKEMMKDVEIMMPKREAEKLEIIENKREAPVDDGLESNEIDNARWAPLHPRKFPDFPE